MKKKMKRKKKKKKKTKRKKMKKKMKNQAPRGIIWSAVPLPHFTQFVG